MIINATHIGSKIDGIGRFSLVIAKHFLNKYEVIINKNAIKHFSKSDQQKLTVISSSISPDYGFIGHLKRLLFTNTLKGDILNLSQLEVSFFNKNQIIIVHDLIPLLFPKYHKKQYLFFKYILPFVLKHKTKQIVTVSHHTKTLLKKYYNIENVKVIYNGIQIPPHHNYKKENYILYVGRNSPTKNIDRLIKSFINLKQNQKFKEYKLYLVGVDENYTRDDIISLGYVEDEKLDILYKKAKIFFFPSLYEGFGYPVIEAMARNTAVITSKNSSLYEICQDSALYIDPYDINDMTNKLEYLLLNDEVRTDLQKRGQKNVLRFDINNTLKEYDKLLSFKGYK